MATIRAYPRPPVRQDTRTRRALRGTEAPQSSGGGGGGGFIFIGETVAGDSTGATLGPTNQAVLKAAFSGTATLASCGFFRENGWPMFLNNNLPNVNNMVDDEFVFSFETAAP